MGEAIERDFHSTHYFVTRFPKNVEVLLGKRVVSVTVGSKHVVIATDDNQIFGWGCNEHGQLGTGLPTLVTQPTLLCSIRGKSISGNLIFAGN